MTDEKKYEETIECRGDLCGREAYLEGEDWYFCKCGWNGSSYDEVASLKKAFIIAVRHVGYHHSQSDLWYALDELGLGDLFDFDEDYSAWGGEKE